MSFQNNTELSEDLEFQYWYEKLEKFAKKHGTSVADKDAWYGEFQGGKAAEKAFFDEYPEHMETCTGTAKQHTKPCKECPWTKKSAPGWLGASQPGEFLAQSDSNLRMPCHMAGIDYDAPGWEAQAATAPQCAGRAIFMANRAQLPKQGLLRLPADRDLVFSRPHEFVAHHARVPAESLAKTMIFDLYEVKRASTPRTSQ